MIGNGNHPGLSVPTEETYDIRIARDGSWWHEGRLVTRQGLVRLFASVLSRDDHGDFWLITPAERGCIAVEDAPFVAVEVRVDGKGGDRTLSFRTNLDEWVTAGPEHPIVARDGKLYVPVRRGLEALLARSVYYEVMELAEGEPPAVWSGGTAFALESV